MPKHPKKSAHPKQRKKTPPDGYCGAKTRSGTTCRKPPLKGATRCRLHGGASPNSLEAARKRILAAADPAALTLVSIATNEETYKTESGFLAPVVPAASRIKAAEAILNRAGLPRATEVKHSGDVTVAMEARERLRSVFEEGK